jgi:hypothetical protein
MLKHTPEGLTDYYLCTVYLILIFIYFLGQQQGQSVSLEDLLHKPVARVQKNSLSLQDLLKHTPEGSPDHAALTESLHLIQNFLNEYNLGMPLLTFNSH